MADVDTIVKVLQDLDSNLDIGEGTPLYEAFVKPATSILQPYDTMVQKILLSQSLANKDQLTDAQIDELVENMFVNRKQGKFSTGYVRIYFVEPVDARIEQFTSFYGPDNLEFLALTAVSISKAEMSSNLEDYLYYIEVPIISSDYGDEYQVGSGTIARADLDNQLSYSKISNPEPTTISEDTESTDDYIERAKEAIASRNLISQKGAEVYIPELFTSIKDIILIGKSKPEMKRDIIFGYHFGGYTDIYVKDLNIEESYYVADNVTSDDNVIEINVSSDSDLTDIPILQIKSVRVGYYANGLFVAEETLIKASEHKDVAVQPSNITGITITEVDDDIPDGIYTLFYDNSKKTIKIGTGQEIDITDDGSYTITTSDLHYINLDVTAVDLPDEDVSEDIIVIIVREDITDPTDGHLYWDLFNDYDIDEDRGERQVPAKYYRYSSRDDFKIRLRDTDGDDVTREGKAVRVDYEWLPIINEFQDYIDNDERISAENILAKSFIPVVIDVTAEVEIPSDAVEEPDFNSIVSTFINSYEGEAFEISDVIDVLYDNSAVKVKLPITVKGTVKNINGEDLVIKDSDEIKIEESPDNLITNRIIRYITGDVNITVSS